MARNVLVSWTPIEASMWALVAGAGLLGLRWFVAPVISVRPGPKLFAVFGLVILVAAAVGSSDSSFGEGEQSFEVIFLDVGQGDATLLRGPDSAILVDGGGRRNSEIAGPVLVPALAHLGVRRLDAVVMTHADGDHCRGLVELMSYLPVDEVWMSSGWSGPCAEAIQRRRGLRRRYLHRGSAVEHRGWRFDTLWPPAAALRKGNESSLVLRAMAAGRSVLLTGDVGKETEAQLLDLGVESALNMLGADMLAADILKVGHHGSRSSSSGRFLDAVSPRLAVISCGRGNRYGHPHASVVGRLADRRVTTLRTDRQGLVGISWRYTGPLLIRLPAMPSVQ